mmetsp:Transcript_85299/g.265116  ORF Transcript_85299/g.265116 Transcript_85299/m.265116 type:complete len:116 (+) Transcript_85299:1571-1918(+)
MPTCAPQRAPSKTRTRRLANQLAVAQRPLVGAVLQDHRLASNELAELQAAGDGTASSHLCHGFAATPKTAHPSLGGLATDVWEPAWLRCSLADFLWPQHPFELQVTSIATSEATH